jgi:biotin carboxylase
VTRILLIASTTGYQVHSFADAAARLGIDLILATDRCHILENPWGDNAMAISDGLDALAAQGPFDGIVAVADQPAFIAAQAAERLGLRFSAPDAVAAAKSKFLARQKFRDAGLLVPSFELVNPDTNPAYPCVLKPTSLSASRGVIRANNPREFRAALARIAKILENEADRSIQVESFIPGREFALEGVVTNGRLHMLALFDKPDPLDGPFFEETIYLTPSREPSEIQRAIFDTTQRAATALGLTDGPLHSEMRVNDAGVWMLEIAARPIGGLCSRVLRFDSEVSLEEILLRHAIGEDVSKVRLQAGAHGVMMIPIPAAGVYRGVDGVEDARAVDGIEDVVITAKEGQKMLPLPEGASYLGFLFARAGTPAAVDRSLRQAHASLRFHFAGVLPVVR